MILLNFSHPITESQRGQIEALAGEPVADLREYSIHFDEQQPFGAQLDALMAGIDLRQAQWQGEPILVVLPSLNFIAAALLAELHGRMGYFPPVVRTRPAAGSGPRRYEVAEMLDLQSIRESARRSRE
ncbi:MAG: hypothetical protein IPM07_23800 [Anaerolineales bacterium]|nr:hypothetical protein [Anaerolineales bacterium]